MPKPVNAIYELGVPHNIFPLPLPDGTYYPDYLANKDERPGEFLRGFDRCRDRDWSECSFLDLGCSEGSTTLRLAQSGATVYGVEGRADGIQRAKVLQEIVGFHNVDFSVGNVDHDSSFREVDGIFNAGILYHLEDPVTFLERCAANARMFMYVDTGHAPRSQEELEGSKFCAAFRDRFTIDYKGLTLDAINFHEPSDTNEKQKNGLRRKPRAGIGNTNSVWLSHASLVDLMRELGFPFHEVVSDRPIIPRLRTCFWREEPSPAGELEALAELLPAAVPQQQAVANARARDIAYLQAQRRPVIALGREPLLANMIGDMQANGIEVADVLDLPGDEGDPVVFTHLRALCAGKSGLLSVAIAQPKDAVFRLMLLDQFEYIFTSFGMYNSA